MLKRRSNIFAVLILGIALSVSSVVNASVLPDTHKAENVQQGRQKSHKSRGMRGAVYKVLTNNVGLSEADIKNGMNSGKTAFDMAKAKGYTPDQLKSMIVEERSKNLDEKVKSGKMTREKADKILSHFKTRIQDWDGNLTEKNDKERS